MDFKCDCINCQNLTSQELTTNENNFQELFAPNKRYESHVNTSELYRTLNIPDRFEHPCK